MRSITEIIVSEKKFRPLKVVFLTISKLCAFDNIDILSVKNPNARI